jgi:hypothetical protein
MKLLPEHAHLTAKPIGAIHNLGRFGLPRRYRVIFLLVGAVLRTTYTSQS